MREPKEKTAERSVSAVLSESNPVLYFGLGLFQVGMTTRWLPLGAGPSSGAADMQSLLLLSCFVAILCFAFFFAVHAKVSQWLSSLPWKVGSASLAMLGVAFVSLGGVFAAAEITGAWFALTAVLTGVGSALLLITWAVRCIESGSVLDFTLAFLVAVIGLAACGLLSSAHLMGSATATVLSLLPTAFSSLLLFFEKGKTVSRGWTVEGWSQNLSSFMLKVGLGALLVSMANEMIKLLRPEHAATVLKSGVESWVMVAIMAAITAGVIHQLRSGKSSGFYFICKCAVVLCVIGALLFPYAGVASSLLFSVSTAGRQCLQLLVWMIVYLVCRKHKLSAVAFFSFMSVAWNGGSLAGSALFDAFWDMGPFESILGDELISVAAVLLLVIAYVFLFSEKDSDLMFGEDRAAKKERVFHQVCEGLCEKGRLTNREQEVFYLLAKGAPVSAIEEKLYISSSTVATHMKHIYQKLGVHSRGELYDLVDNALKAQSSDK